MNAFKSQQHRWAKGSIQTCRKVLPMILRSDLPIGVKTEAFFHLTANFNYLLMCVLSVLMAPSMVIRYNMGWYEMLLIDVPLFFAATASVANFYMVCQRELHKDWMTRLKYLPFLMSIGIGLTRQQHARGARGALQAGERVRAHAEVPHRGADR
jgi:cellulose synthase/poly-beta-1,6-N-acetylglucosamine synthase-like glycosyltransferase